MIYLHTKFPLYNSSISLLIAIKKLCRFHAAAILFSYVLQKIALI